MCHQGQHDITSGKNPGVMSALFRNHWKNYGFTTELLAIPREVCYHFQVFPRSGIMLLVMVPPISSTFQSPIAGRPSLAFLVISQQGHSSNYILFYIACKLYYRCYVIPIRKIPKILKTWRNINTCSIWHWPTSTIFKKLCACKHNVLIQVWKLCYKTLDLSLMYYLLASYISEQCKFSFFMLLLFSKIEEWTNTCALDGDGPFLFPQIQGRFQNQTEFTPATDTHNWCYWIRLF